MGGWVDKRSWANPGAKVVVDRLLSAGLLVDKGAVLGESAEVRFSLRLDERPLLTLHVVFTDRAVSPPLTERVAS